MSLYAFLGAVEQGLTFGLMALGVFLSFKVLDFPDLTVDGSFPLGACVSAALIHLGIHPYLTLPVAAAAGFMAGLVTAWLSVRLRILNLLASIITMIALYSVNIRILGGPNLTLLNQPSVFAPFFGLGLPDHVVQLLFALAISILVVGSLVWFLNTEIGLGLRATGDNPEMVRAVGVNTSVMILGGVGLSNALVAVSGALVAQSQGAADVGMGVGTIIAGLASVILGVSIFGEGGMLKGALAVVFGSLLYRILIFLALSVRVGDFSITPSDLNLITAAMVVIALTFPALRRHVRLRVMR